MFSYAISIIKGKYISSQPLEKLKKGDFFDLCGQVFQTYVDIQDQNRPNGPFTCILPCPVKIFSFTLYVYFKKMHCKCTFPFSLTGSINKCLSKHERYI